MARISKEKKEEIRSSIVAFATESFLENGYEKTSTKAIAKQVGIAEGTLFNYFKTKADLYMEVFAHELQLNEEHLTEPQSKDNRVSELISDYVKQLYSPMLRYPKFMMREMIQVFLSISKKNFKKFEKLAMYDFKYMEMTEKFIEKLIVKGVIQEGTDAKLLSDMIYGGVFLEFTMYMYKDDMTKEEMIEKIDEKIQFVCKGYLS